MAYLFCSPWPFSNNRPGSKGLKSSVSALFGVIFSPRDSGLAVLEKQRRLFVMVAGDEIVVTSDAGFRAAYCRRPHHPQLIIRSRTDTDDHEVIAQAWEAANDKAREIGWIGTPITHFPVKRRRP
ncbi:MAG: hypothetical protein WBF49_06980 [Methyloceanibacter sp.]|jgi:hypothetical protein